MLGEAPLHESNEHSCFSVIEKAHVLTAPTSFTPTIITDQFLASL
jgi:hypothetical protein